MKPQIILILGNKDSQDLMGMVFRAGYIPIIRDELHSALSELRYKKCNAIVIDYERTHTDVLEFLLNVKDILTDIRVFVVHDKPEEAEQDLVIRDSSIDCISRQQLKKKLTPTIIPLPDAEGRPYSVKENHKKTNKRNPQ